jgi:hypothetical protein
MSDTSEWNDGEDKGRGYRQRLVSDVESSEESWVLLVASGIGLHNGAWPDDTAIHQLLCSLIALSGNVTVTYILF